VPVPAGFEGRAVVVDERPPLAAAVALADRE